MNNCHEKFSIQCKSCMSYETDIIPYSQDGYWDDGYKIVCYHCENEWPKDGEGYRINE